MKRRHLLLFGAVALFLASCQTVAEKVSGNYVGGIATWTASGPGIVNTSGVGNGQFVLTPNGSKTVNGVFSSPGNPNVAVNNIDITDIFGTYIFDISSANSNSGAISISGTIAANIMALTYDNNIDSVHLSLADFNK